VWTKYKLLTWYCTIYSVPSITNTSTKLGTDNLYITCLTEKPSSGNEATLMYCTVRRHGQLLVTVVNVPARAALTVCVTYLYGVLEHTNFPLAEGGALS
jgi:hypothetical protein